MSNFPGVMAEMHKWGVERVTLPGTRKLVFRVRCSCGEVLDKSIKSTLPPEAVVKFIEQTGWALSKKHPPVCVSCQEKEKEMARKKTVTDEEIRYATNSHTTPVDSWPVGDTPLEPDRLNPKIVRQVYTMLESVFDEHNGRYEKGWSDERIATGAGVDVQHVTSIRKEAYGEIKEDPEIIKLRGRFDALKAEIFDTENAILTQMDEKMKPLREQLNQLDQALKEQGA